MIINCTGNKARRIIGKTKKVVVAVVTVLALAKVVVAAVVRSM